MIALDDVVVSFTKGDATFSVKIAVRRAAQAVPEIMELFRAVVDKDTVVTHHVERSRFAPESRRTRERVTSIWSPPDPSQMVVLPKKISVAAAAADGFKKGRGRPRGSNDNTVR